jgi:hypothetical protein
MKIPRASTFLWTAVACGALLAAGYGITACGNGGGGTATGMSQLTTTITDPAECSAAVGGDYKAVYVTITDVQANVNGSASANGSGWVDLTPKDAKLPMQINLLGSNASGGCFLAKLGDNLEVQAGNYHQIRLVLASNSNPPMLANNETNTCSATGGLSGVNCIEYKNKAGNWTWSALTTPSAQQTGIKILPTQLSGGSLDLAAGKTEDLVINFQTCESIVQAGNSGQFLLQPVLNAGQVSTSSSTINGTVVDSAGNPIAGNVLVSLEQPDANGVDRVMYSTMAAADGTFSFCSLLDGQTSGTYDVVVSAYNPTTGQAYNTAVETGVQIGDTTGTIKLTASPVYGAVTLNGLVTTTSTSNTAVAEGVNLTPLEPNPVSGATTKYFTVPMLQTTTNDVASLPTLTTSLTYADLTTPTTTDNCAANVACVSYFMTVPSAGISVSPYSTSGPGTAVSSTSTEYVVDGIIAAPTPVSPLPSGLSEGTGVCTQTELPDLTTVTPTTVTPAAPATTVPSVTVNPVATPLAFTGCS